MRPDLHSTWKRRPLLNFYFPLPAPLRTGRVLCSLRRELGRQIGTYESLPSLHPGTLPSLHPGTLPTVQEYFRAIREQQVITDSDYHIDRMGVGNTHS